MDALLSRPPPTSQSGNAITIPQRRFPALPNGLNPYLGYHLPPHFSAAPFFMSQLAAASLGNMSVMPKSPGNKLSPGSANSDPESRKRSL